MSKTAMRSLIVAVMMASLWTGTTSTGKANELGDSQKREEARGEKNVKPEVVRDIRGQVVAQLFYPSVGEDPAFRVVGRGKVSQPADKATLQFKFIPDYPDEQPEGTLSDFETTDEPVGKQKLQPIVDALVKIGVLTDEIEVKIVEPSTNTLPFPFPSTAIEGGGEILVTVAKPNRDRMKEIVDAVTEATDKLEEILLDNVKVEYTVDDCQALELAAYQSAVADAQHKANSIAAALGVELKKAPSVAEPFYAIFIPGCNSRGNLPFVSQRASIYDPNAPVAVEVSKDMFFTYRVR
ncbi:MAG TPA: hypothetical protein DEG17_01800 [Cyanobacteria bacterium UBA11149]|nr:hypothetical protein [Cyanobacteria bacterium UBA11367]HBE58790.1 hypothetical protein [Cyanobacteria bacterium UBA11366]HBK66320.1 hypothetical protein [Cyanobacteria bacterium UBA11166]HBR77138.1 hypothetical protein [Cyanobacteria bacterium UBA11159]HBS67626.1 hypothetical protein [Cyanobacteria bacterium UBA11153]HBW87644.1 hypothetical protein [Cyanobacteria bacterium UBA11149]HCA96701.1 hypothetical protein [Cyanobacteria bacterium UBA9226]